jgi:NAD(P)-dependent dehydrogenase (short-subunit alcohol dehydrogenase family)
VELRERVAVITGAASGIGLALTERCLREGMAVVMADIEADRLHAEGTRLREAGAPVTVVECDVADPAQVDGLRDASLAAHGAVHLLCNNAGVAAGRPNVKTTPEQWRWIVGVNLLGPAYACSAFAPLLVEQGVGHIVNTASEAGLVSSPFLGAYHASKYGVVGLSESLCLELAGTGVGVSCLCPELVETRIFDSIRNAPPELGLGAPNGRSIDAIEQRMGSKAMRPADVAGLVVYAVRADQFWIVTHAATAARLRARNEDLQSLRNPRFPAA